MEFPKNFVWGEATAAYQVEGASHEDGKGLHIWDVFCREKGRIEDGSSGDIACDHYHRFAEDVSIMKEMGIKAYRFSLSWSRILPDGIGSVNEKGINFYDRLIDELKAAGIEPYITLFHWDYPYALYEKGGWMNPDSVLWFGEYARVVAEHFSHKVKHFFTLNEPQCFIGMAYLDGLHAPGLHAPLRDTFQMAHHVLMAHGMAVKMMRKYGEKDIKIGYAPTGTMDYPASNKPEDVEAARSTLFGFREDDRNWAWNVSFWSDPVILGHYPPDALERFERYLPTMNSEDLKLMCQPLDFYGQNIYNGRCIRAGKEGKPEQIPRYKGFPQNSLGWPVTPESLYWGPKFLYERYNLPIYITENGMACHDTVSVDGRVHDPNRIDFLARYLGCLKEAIGEGIDVRGYFHWSLLDNFEWHSGYSQRFGMIYVDYRNQKRIWKDSAFWYQKMIRENGSEIFWDRSSTYAK